MLSGDNSNNIINEFIPINTTNKTELRKKDFISKKIFDYNDYINKKTTTLKEFKIPELKSIAKENHLHISGTKPILIERILGHFNKVKKTIKIQSFYRGWIVRCSIILRGPALNNRSLCVNDTDFVTMEPIKEVPYEYFFSYKDSKDFIYGFDISSLIELMKKSSKVLNPYNREKFDNQVVNDIKKLYKFSFIVYPSFKKDNESLTKPIINQPVIRQMNIIPPNPTMNTFIAFSSEEQVIRIQNLLEHRNNSISQRINNLFSEIDLLGNYTSSTWFTSLQLSSYPRLFRSLHDIWYYRSRLSRETRLKICPLLSPFIPINSPLDHSNENLYLNLRNVQTLCLEVMENLVFMGIDDDHRKLGTFHSLTALTIVSPEARNSMPWLYESVNFF